MTMNYRCKHFTIQELVDPTTHSAYGDKAWQFLDPRLLMTLDQLRSDFGVCIINTWFSTNLANQYGFRTDSGFRHPSSRIGAPLSQHRFGRAADCLFPLTGVDNVRSAIIKKPEDYPYISAIELGTSWLHIDCRNVKPLMTFRP